MSVLKKLVSNVRKLFENADEDHCESADYEQLCSDHQPPQYQDTFSNQDFPGDLQDTGSTEASISHPRFAIDQGDENLPDEDSKSLNFSSSEPTAFYGHAADSATWGTPLDLLYLSEECHELLEKFNIETIEQLSNSVDDELLIDHRFTKDMRFEIQSQLAEWQSHTMMLSQLTFGEDDYISQRFDNNFSLDKHFHLTILDLAANWPEEKWFLKLPDPLRQEQSGFRHKDCYSCNMPLNVLRSLLDDCNQLPCELAIEKISEACEEDCLYFDEDYMHCTEDHIKAYVRRLDERWELIGDMIRQRVESPTRVPEHLNSFIEYLTTNNNSSYKLVLASIFFDNMNKKKCVSIVKLRNQMFFYYKKRKDNGLVVEAEGLIVTKIDLLNQYDIEKRVLKNPLKSFIDSNYFILNDDNLMISVDLLQVLRDHNFYNYLLKEIKQALKLYFELQLKLLSPRYYFDENTVLKEETDNKIDLNYMSISIKRKLKSKIKL